MARFQILSDLHLETPAAYDLFPIPPEAPYLVLLGDIGNARDDDMFSFLEAQVLKFEIVFFLLGNHEPYYSSWPEARERLNNFAAAHPGKFIFLDQTRYDVSADVTILGCTLHSYVTEAQEEHVSFGLNDFFHIKDWTVLDHRGAHEADLKWLNTQVTELAKSEPQRKIVVFTHHSPAAADARAVDPTRANSPISSGFATDLSGEACWVSPQVCTWVFGHTHYNCDFTDEGTGKRVVGNMRGYYFSQAGGFEPKKVITIESDSRYNQ